ncbi:MAG: hypothetical protein DME32_17850 [Verrucomicrobia bacterium]|nr:MAG: hypothetical protein DME32_17850 [Verrucomicrobiota bacterium]
MREIGDLFGGLNYAAVAQRLRRVSSEDKQQTARLLSQGQKYRACCPNRWQRFTRGSPSFVIPSEVAGIPHFKNY